MDAKRTTLPPLQLSPLVEVREARYFSPEFLFAHERALEAQAAEEAAQAATSEAST